MKKKIQTQLPATSSVYRINGTNGATCILIRTDALLSIQYRDIYKHDQEADVFLPDYPELSGVCDEDDSSISLTFKGFKMGIDFKKTPGGERWYVSNVDVIYSSSNDIFQHVDRPGLDVSIILFKKNHLNKKFIISGEIINCCSQYTFISNTSREIICLPSRTNRNNVLSGNFLTKKN